MAVTIDYERNYMYLNSALRKKLEGDKVAIGLDEEEDILAIKADDNGYSVGSTGHVGAQSLVKKIKNIYNKIEKGMYLVEEAGENMFVAQID